MKNVNVNSRRQRTLNSTASKNSKKKLRISSSAGGRKRNADVRKSSGTPKKPADKLSKRLIR